MVELSQYKITHFYHYFHKNNTNAKNLMSFSQCKCGKEIAYPRI